MIQWNLSWRFTKPPFHFALHPLSKLDMYPQQFEKLVQILRKLPGVGWRNAEKLAFTLLDWPAAELQSLAQTLEKLPHQLHFCQICGCLYQVDCPFCDLRKRDAHQLLIIATAREVFAVESSGIYKGLYHVLGGLISPIDQRYGESLRLEPLTKRVEELEKLSEIIVALDSTADGDMTALYAKQAAEKAALSPGRSPPKLSRIAFGLPIGSSVENADYATLARAVSSRQFF